jgi:hypothetical protein
MSAPPPPQLQVTPFTSGNLMARNPALFAQLAAAFNRPPLVRDPADLAGMSAWDPVLLAEAVAEADQVGIVDGSSRMSTDTQN